MNRTKRLRWSRRYVWLALPVVAAGYYLVEHNWQASDYFANVTFNYDGTENRTADRLDAANYGSTAGRLGLALFGILGLIVPGASRLGWRKPLFWAIVCYVSWLAITVLWSIDPALSAYKLGVLGVFGIAAFGISKHLSAREIVWVSVVSCVLYVTIGAGSELFFGTFHPRADDYRFTGTTHPNTQAIYGAIICLSATMLIGKGQGTQRFFLGLVFLGVGILVMLLTKSRTSLAAFGLAVIAAQGLRAKGTQRVVLVVSGLAALTLATFVLSLAGTAAQSKLSGAAEMGRSEDMSSLSGRIPLWEELLDSYVDRPMLGHGYMAFWDPEQVEYLGDLFNWEIPHAHNLYLDVLLDGGVVALGLYLILIAVAMLTCAKAYRRTQDTGYAFAFGMLFFLVLHGISESLMKLPTFPSFVLLSLLFRLIWEPSVSTTAEDDLLDDVIEAAPQLVEV